MNAKNNIELTPGKLYKCNKVVGFFKSSIEDYDCILFSRNSLFLLVGIKEAHRLKGWTTIVILHKNILYYRIDLHVWLKESFDEID